MGLHAGQVEAGKPYLSGFVRWYCPRPLLVIVSVRVTVGWMASTVSG